MSGPLAVGKTAVADALVEQFGFKKVSSSGHLRRVAERRDLSTGRETLRELGDLLDEETGFAWLIDDVAVPQVQSESTQTKWFVDAVRKSEQVAHFRETFADVLHVHFTAPEAVLKARFLARKREGDDVHVPGSYERFVAHPNEQAARSLIQIADLIIDLSRVRAHEAAEQVAGYDGGGA
jgi:adenylosuccinate synthase